MTDALHDAVTGLPSRALLREHVRVALARARKQDRSVALLHLGLDGFGLVNDSLGHPAGDAVLREAAGRIRLTVPEVHVVARADGDQLCVLLADLQRDAAEAASAIGAQLLAVLGEPFAAAGRKFELGATAGVSVHPDDAQDADALLRHADAALREGKAGHRGELVFYAGGTSDALRRLLLTGRLRTALQRDELFLEYQPIVRLPTGGIPIVEALIRWQDPEHGVIAPPDFIPAAEHCGLIEGIGDWVVDAAVAQARAWQDEGHEVAVSFNASLKQFREPGFAERVGRALAEHGVHPTRLVVEVTETTAMLDPACVEPVLADLRRLGVRVAIDDFGVGHSALGRLRDLDVDILKLDGSFLPRTPDDRRAVRLLGAALGLVEALGLTPVAEGVETEDQLRLLTDRGCRLAQGFHLGRPMPASAVSALLGARAGAPPAGRGAP